MISVSAYHLKRRRQGRVQAARPTPRQKLPVGGGYVRVMCVPCVCDGCFGVQIKRSLSLKSNGHNQGMWCTCGQYIPSQPGKRLWLAYTIPQVRKPRTEAALRHLHLPARHTRIPMPMRRRVADNGLPALTRPLAPAARTPHTSSPHEY